MCKSSGCGHESHDKKPAAPYEKSLAYRFPAIAKEYRGDFDPRFVWPGRKAVAKWECSTCSHVWFTCITGRTSSRGRGCPKCAEKKRAESRSTAPFEKSIAFKCPEILVEYRGPKDPRAIYICSEQIFEWQCQGCLKLYLAKVKDRVKAKIGCPDCRGENQSFVQSIAPASKSLAIKNPELLPEYRGERDPKTIFATSGTKYPWECSVCGHTWKAQVYERAQNGRGCPECGKKKRAESKAKAKFEKSLAFKFPELLKEYRGEKDPKTINPGTEVKFLWECCKCSRKWMASANKRVFGRGCPDCGLKKISEINLNAPYEKSLAFKCPDLVREYRGTRDPKTVFYASGEKVSWECSVCSNKWEAVISSRSSAAKCGCPKCSRHGYDQSKPSLFYLIARPGQIKFGIMNVGSGRLDRHRVRGGWGLIDSVEMSGDGARSMETTIKRRLRKLGIPTGREAFRHEFDGYSEAFQEVDLSVRTIRGLCRKLRVDLDSFLSA